MERERDLVVEVVHALHDRVIAASAHVRPGTTVEEVIDVLEFQLLLPDVDVRNAPVGIFGRAVPRNTPVRDGDRIEIYRPLVADPKQARRQRSSRKLRSGT
jgi:putative ubiquitin-RnfH superfamily antitoxin RatB of RatAB toxin-antitoxin module